jgi:hypothetical protein
VFYFPSQYCISFVHLPEWCKVCCSANCSVVAPHCFWHGLGPFAFLLAFEYFLDCFKYQGVGTFSHTIRLMVIHRWECNLHSDLLAKILEHCTVKVLCIVDYYVPGDTTAADDLLPEKFLIVTELTLVRSFASTHFIKYSTATTVKV